MHPSWSAQITFPKREPALRKLRRRMRRADLIENRLREWRRRLDHARVNVRFDRNEAIKCFCKAMKGSMLGDGIPFGGTRDYILMHCVSEEAWETIVILMKDDAEALEAAIFTFLLAEHKRIGPRGNAP